MFEKLRTFIKNASRQRSQNPELISYQTTRKAIGWLGLSLPFILLLGSMALGKCTVIQPSISHYYYTNMREILEGILCAVSLFLFSYKGFSRMDSIATNLAGFFALMVALFPTDIFYLIKDTYFPCQNPLVYLIDFPNRAYVHTISASLFFITLALISLFLFTKSTHGKDQQTPQKRIRNLIYRVCGILMLLSIFIVFFFIVILHGDQKKPIIFWFETLALVSFGISWLTKGETLFGDPPVKKQEAHRNSAE